MYLLAYDKQYKNIFRNTSSIKKKNRRIQKVWIEYKRNTNGVITGKIEEKNENIYIYVKGLEINDIEHRGEYYFKVDDNTDLLYSWGYSEKSFLDLEPGLTICITSTGKIIKSTGLITRVPKIQLLENIE